MPVPQYYTETPAISVEWYDESFHTSNTTNIYVSCQSISKRRNAAWEYLSVLISSPFHPAEHTPSCGDDLEGPRTFCSRQRKYIWNWLSIPHARKQACNLRGTLRSLSILTAAYVWWPDEQKWNRRRRSRLQLFRRAFKWVLKTINIVNRRMGL